MEMGGTYFEIWHFWHLTLVLGIIIVIVVLLRQISHRHRRNADQQRQFETDRQAALEAERKKQMLVVHPKSSVSSPQTRVPLADPFGTPFTGNIQGSAAKWEAEIHQIGRHIIGQIDSKMAALQVITLDANRAANRLELLVEHLEHIAWKHVEWQQNQKTQHAQTEHMPTTASPTVIPVAESSPEAAPVVLKEFADNLAGVRKAIKQSTAFSEQPMRATIQRLSEVQTKNLRSEVEMLSNYGLDAHEIARRLEISPGEVDVMLQFLQHR